MNNWEIAGRQLAFWARHTGICVVFWALSIAQPSGAQSVEYLPGIDWPEPPIITPGREIVGPPSDAIVLFDGKDLSAWENGESWKVENGVATVSRKAIRTKQSFGDCQLHLEWSSPVPARGESQGRGNSGIYFMGLYEVQILDSYQNKTYFDGQAGAIYKQTPPMANAMRPPGEWNLYDIVFTAPRFGEDGSLQSPAYLTLIHNGVLLHNHFELTGSTEWNRAASYEPHAAKLPIMLQDHGNPVRFRNIWLRELKPIVGTQAREPRYHSHATGKEWLASEADHEGNPISE